MVSVSAADTCHRPRVCGEFGAMHHAAVDLDVTNEGSEAAGWSDALRSPH